MRDLESTNLEAAAYLAREADPGWDDRPSPSEYEDEPQWCALCGMSPMPIASRLPDGCYAHPGCVSDPVFARTLAYHQEEAQDG